MKKKKGLIFGLSILIVLVGIISCFTIKVDNTYALENEIYEGFSGLYLATENATASIGENIYVDLSLDRYMWDDTLSMYFKSTTSGDEFNVFLKNIDLGNPYIIVPNTAKVGETYELTKFYLYTNGDNGFGYGAGPEFVTNENDHHQNNSYVDLGNKKYITIVEKEQEEVNEIQLNSFRLKDSGVFVGENVYVSLKYTGEVSSMYLTLRHAETAQEYNRSIEKVGEDYRFKTDGAISLVPGNYELINMSLCDESSKCVLYTSSTYGIGDKLFDFGDDLAVWEKELAAETSFKLAAVNLNTFEAVVGDKVEVDVNANKDIYSALLVFYDNTNDTTFSAYVKNLKGHPYFMLPSTATAGNYRLQTVIIQDSEGNNQVVNVPEFEGKSYTDENGIFYETIELTVKEDTIENKDSLVFNNEDYNDLILKKIDSLNETAVITVICDNSPIVSGSLFEAIAETRKTLILKYGDTEWVFNGTDIENPKFIDVSILITSIKDSDFSDSNITDKISKDDTSVLNFASNGILPGKVLIRLNSTELDSKFGNADIFVYYYNDKDDSLIKVALEVQKIEGYYEFYINHNSKYILTTKALSENVVSNDDSLLKLNKTYIIDIEEDNYNNDYNNIILIGLSAIVLVILVYFIIRLRKNK